MPFARSRIKALRATGLTRASQQFEIDGVSVKVRIAGEHEYIQLNGSSETPLSGVIKIGELITTPSVDAGAEPTYTLRKYRPTQNAWDYPLKKNPEKSPATFNDETKLANSETGTQYVDVLPSMYSGLMAKAVQVHLGLGRIVGFKTSFAISHGIVAGADGALWLAEISGTNGVLVKPLKVSRASKTSKIDAVKHSALIFGGIPAETSFPEGEKLTEAIASGKVHRLLTQTQMQPFFGKNAFSADLGFSFGSKAAVNTCCFQTEGVHTSYLYRVNFGINSKDDILSLGVGTASIELLEQGAIDLKSTEYPAFFFESAGGVVSPLPNIVTNYTIDAEYPVLAFYRDDVLETVRVKNQAAVSINTSYGTPFDATVPVTVSYGTYTKNAVEGQYIKSDLLVPYDALISETKSDSTRSVAAVAEYCGGGQGLRAYAMRVVNSNWGINNGSGRQGFWGKLERDGFSYYAGAESRYTNRFDTTTTENPYASNTGGIIINTFDTVNFNIAGSSSPWLVTFYVTPQDLRPYIDTNATFNVTGTYQQALDVAYAHLNSANVDTRFNGAAQWFSPALNAGISENNSFTTPGGAYFNHASGAQSSCSSTYTLNQADAMFMWKRLNLGPPLKFACSMFGPRPHHYNVDLATGDLDISDPQGERKILEGTLFSGESSVETDPYNFIGYI